MFKKLVNLFRNPWTLAVLSALLLRLAYPKTDAWMLAWVAFVPLFGAIEGRKPLHVFLLGLGSGAVFYITTLYWLIYVSSAGMVVLSLYLALYVAVFAVIFRFAQDRLPLAARFLFLPACWVILEYLRSTLMTGFPWALLAYSQTSNLVAIQVADFCGAPGVSFLVMLMNLVIFEATGMRRPGVRVRWQPFVAPILLFWVWWYYGLFRLVENPKTSVPLRVAIVQGNIPQEVKWVEKFSEGIFRKHALLTEIAILRDEPDLVLWPETSVSDYLEISDNDKAIRDLVGRVRVPLLLGSIRLEKMKFYNSALLYRPPGRLAGVYDKIHLVPFGEFLPLRRVLPALARIVPIEDFTPGESFDIFSVKGASGEPSRFGVLICFEDIFADVASTFVRSGADFLVNITNDGWFGDTASPYQHLQASIFRAVENRVYVVRSANTGISCIIDDAGRIRTTVRSRHGKPTYVSGFASELVYKTGREGSFTFFGDAFVLLCLGAAAGLLLIRPARQGAGR